MFFFQFTSIEGFVSRAKNAVLISNYFILFITTLSKANVKSINRKIIVLYFQTASYALKLIVIKEIRASLYEKKKKSSKMFIFVH